MDRRKPNTSSAARHSASYAQVIYLWTLQRTGIALLDGGLYTILFLLFIRLWDFHALVCVIARRYTVLLLSQPRNLLRS